MRVFVSVSSPIHVRSHHSDRIQASDYVVASHGNASPSDRGADRQSEDGQGEDVIRMPQPSGPLGSPPPDDSAPASSFPAKTSPSAKSSSRGGSTWSRGHRRMNDAANSFFYRLGYWVATHAKSTVLISLVLVAACCFGFASFRQETDGKGHGEGASLAAALFAVPFCSGVVVLRQVWLITVWPHWHSSLPFNRRHMFRCPLRCTEVSTETCPLIPSNKPNVGRED